mmetsp:Transcript_48322/g.81339  ORF Transcript_48322/g.81339 Transcript_48322/m.81339 type:complete len:116 (+) Transcript_48322:757-1104(+)
MEAPSPRANPRDLVAGSRQRAPAPAVLWMWTRVRPGSGPHLSHVPHFHIAQELPSASVLLVQHVDSGTLREGHGVSPTAAHVVFCDTRRAVEQTPEGTQQQSVHWGMRSGRHRQR